jgi:hypothetical protein
MRWVGKKRGINRVLVGKFEGSRPFARPRHRWKIVFKLTLKK